MAKFDVNIELLEQGDIYFFFKPKKDSDEMNSLDDVARFYFVLQPQGKRNRFIVMGGKQMPTITDGGKRSWGLIQKVGGRGFYASKEGKVQKTSARPVGEGIYALVMHDDHIHLAYSLELPKRLGQVQKSLNIYREGNYIFIVKPKEGVNEIFEPAFPNNLEQEGSELLLIGVNSNLSKLGLKANKDKETEESADIFDQLHVDRSRHPTDPLFKGKWE